MSRIGSILGNIELNEKKQGSTEKTAPQVVTSPPSDDSRIYQRLGCLTYQTIRELRKDSTIQLARWAVLAPMIHTEWMFERKKGATKEMKNFLEDNFIPIRDLFLVQATFGTLDFGWNPFEIIYKPEDGYIWVDNLKSLLPDYTTILVYLNTGKFAGFTNEPYGNYNQSKIITEKYGMVTNFSVEGTDWYGYSVFESLQRICASWDVTQNSANRFDSKIAGATWVVYFPVGETLYKGVKTPNDQIAASVLSSLEASGGVAIPDEVQDAFEDTIDKEAKGKWRIELISASSTSQGSFIDRHKYLDGLKMRAFGITERSILEGKHGTKEEADVHADVTLSIIDCKHRLIANQLNLYCLPALMEYNFGKKYRYSMRIKPAPLVDSKFNMLKEIYSRIIQNSELAAIELGKLDTDEMRNEMGLPSIVGKAA